MYQYMTEQGRMHACVQTCQNSSFSSATPPNTDEKKRINENLKLNARVGFQAQRPYSLQLA
jgi:hypothetical protein